MELASEYTVTKLITKNEILKNNKMLYIPTSIHDLGCFLTQEKSKPSVWGEKYIFIK